MFSQLAFVLLGIIGLRRRALEGAEGTREGGMGGAGGGGDIKFLFPALDVTTVIIDPRGSRHKDSSDIFLEYKKLIHFFNQDDRCQLG